MKRGFTLAEVLITLVVIGVIAAITIPTLMANYRRQEASARLKKTFSMLSNACTRAKADGNDWQDWAYDIDNEADEGTNETSVKFAEIYLLPYINYMKDRGGESSYQLYLNDGTTLTLKKGSCMDFGVDINGEKKPNAHGRDIFFFIYCPYSHSNVYVAEAQVISWRTEGVKTRAQALQKCKEEPHQCTCLLSYDNWEFKKDYPHKI